MTGTEMTGSPRNTSDFGIPAVYKPGYKFYLAKFYHLMRLSLSNLNGSDPVVVFQMGKVGSKTVAETLKLALPGTPVFHTHYITKAGLDFHKNASLAAHRPTLGLPHWTGFYLRSRIGTVPGRWKVISLVRDPIARNFSAFFHDIRHWLPDFYDSDYSSHGKLFEIVDKFVKDYPANIPFDWFDSEMKSVFGIDVFASPFPKEKGYAIYENKPVKLLLLRLEDLNRVSCEAFKEFLDIRIPQLVNANESGSRQYSWIYRRLLEEIALPESYVQNMYASNYSRHFYSRDELEGFRAKWLKKR